MLTPATELCDTNSVIWVNYQKCQELQGIQEYKLNSHDNEVFGTAHEYILL